MPLTTTRKVVSLQPEVCVLVPTRNEAGNIRPLVAGLEAALRGVEAEVLVVDDSDDDTPVVVREVAATSPLPVRLLHRAGLERQGGLGGAVVAGAENTRADWVVVMDGDLQHPPEVVRDLLAAREGLDLVAASRYETQGCADGLASPFRRGVSMGATTAAKALFPGRLRAVSDPMTGFFAVRRDALDLATLRPRGFKILLEILTRTPGLRVGEVPFSFGERAAGESKAGAREAYRYLAQLVSLRLAGLPALAEFLRFALVGATGVAVNLAVLAAALHLVGPRAGDPGVQATAETAATQVAILWNFVLTEVWVFRGGVPVSGRPARLAGYWLVSMLALAVQLPLAAALTAVLPVGYLMATAIALLGLVVARFAVCRLALYRVRPLPAVPAVAGEEAA
jgi:putative flippase GtrA